jgi:hypothetical protein
VIPVFAGPLKTPRTLTRSESIEPPGVGSVIARLIPAGEVAVGVGLGVGVLVGVAVGVDVLVGV